MKVCLASLALFFAFVTGTQAQKIDKYCEVVMYTKVFSVEKCNPHIQLGESDSLFSFKDPSVVASLKKVNKFNTRADVLNYMALLGWTLTGNSAIGNWEQPTAHYYIFKKSFDLAELNAPKTE